MLFFGNEKQQYVSLTGSTAIEAIADAAASMHPGVGESGTEPRGGSFRWTAS
jgi:hypothetical protein